MKWRILDETLYLPELDKLRFNSAHDAINHIEQLVLNATWPNAWFIRKKMNRYYIGVFNEDDIDSFAVVAIIQPV